MKQNSTVPTKYSRIFSFKRLGIASAVMAIVLAGTFSFSSTAHAGLLSFINMVWGNQEVSAQLKQPRVADSQISPVIVLQAPGNPMQLALAQDVPPLEDDTTLSPDVARMNNPVVEAANTQISLYVVRSGDTITSVARMFNVSVNTILWANDLTSRSTLRLGQNLVILPVTGITHTVKSNETIESIAKKYKADIEDILNFNDISISTALKIGDQILIPDAEMQQATVVPKKTDSGPSFAGYYSCPVPGARLSQKIHGHNGVDLAAPVGTPIYAAAGGTVIVNRSNGAWNGGYGNFVVLLHGNGTQTLYSHMTRSAVGAGDAVSKGQLVGYVGMTGLTTGPHLHFEVRGAQNPFSNPALCR